MTDRESGVNYWEARARELAEKLVADGTIAHPLWRMAFENTPRHVFVPRFWALDQYNAPARLVDGANPAQQAEWLDMVYSDQFLAIQWAMQDDHRMITSSASLPTLVARMLHLLNVEENDRVLEIGTGTGYNTALLCRRLGDSAVASIDIDPVLVAEARDRLDQIGYQPHLATGDGAGGLEHAVLYSKILSTCASPGVPAPWIHQLMQGGKIVAPFTVGGALAVLTKTSPNEVSGYLDSEQAWFMPLRSAGKPLPDGHLVKLPDPQPGRHQYHTTSEVDPDAFADPDFRLWLFMHLPPTARIVDTVNNDLARTGLIVYTTHNRATIEFSAGRVPGASRVTQDQRRLFDTVEIAWQTWQRHGRPNRKRIGITAHTNGTQNAWLDTPRSGITWPLPT